MIYIFIDPIVIFIMLSIAALVFFKNKKRKWSRFFGIMAGIWFFVISSSPIPRWMISSLESRFEVFDFDVPKKYISSNILILGGGHTTDNSLPVNVQLSHNSLGRLVEGVRIYRYLDKSKIVFSGQSRSNRMSQAEIMALAALILNVDKADTIMIINSQNTEQEAIHYHDRFGANHPLILVTDASHMWRAMKWFNKNGLVPTPAPTNHLVKIDPDEINFWFKPTLSNIRMMQIAITEYVGILYYYILDIL